jgi:hypothetical protein
MRMALEAYLARLPDCGAPIPAEYAGQWIAWNANESDILAHGRDFSEVHQRAIEISCARPVLEKIPYGPSIWG